MNIARRLDRLTQAALAPGAAAHLTLRTGELLEGVGLDEAVLDVGCGFSSPLSGLRRRPVGVDIDPSRARGHGTTAVAGDAAALPFAAGTFTAVFSFGLLHHLADADARGALGEMLRVVRPSGLVAIFDGVRPHRPSDRPAAALIRSLDRGSHMRSEPALRSLFAGFAGWRFERVTYAATGLEGLWCVRASQSAR